MKQTAIEWLESQLFELRNPTLTQIEIIEEAKEMEKQQIEDAWNNGLCNWDNTDDFNAEQYYNETFKK